MTLNTLTLPDDAEFKAVEVANKITAIPLRVVTKRLAQGYTVEVIVQPELADTLNLVEGRPVSMSYCEKGEDVLIKIQPDRASSVKWVRYAMYRGKGVKPLYAAFRKIAVLPVAKVNGEANYGVVEGGGLLVSVPIGECPLKSHPNRYTKEAKLEELSKSNSKPKAETFEEFAERTTTPVRKPVPRSDIKASELISEPKPKPSGLTVGRKSGNFPDWKDEHDDAIMNRVKAGDSYSDIAAKLGDSVTSAEVRRRHTAISLTRKS